MAISSTESSKLLEYEAIVAAAVEEWDNETQGTEGRTACMQRVRHKANEIMTGLNQLRDKGYSSEVLRNLAKRAVADLDISLLTFCSVDNKQALVDQKRQIEELHPPKLKEAAFSLSDSFPKVVDFMAPQEKDSTLVLKILPEKIPAHFRGTPKSTASRYVIETAAGKVIDDSSGLKKGLGDAWKDVEIWIQNRETAQKIELPKNVQQALLGFLKEGGPRGYCSLDFINPINKNNIKGPPCSFDARIWDFLPLKHGETLVEGDLIHLEDHHGDNHHFALHLSQGLFLSIYGDGGPLAVTTLEEMKEFYSMDLVERLVPISSFSRSSRF